jgi:hypothetical protein
MTYGGGPPQELGASIIYGANQLVLGLALTHNLTVQPVSDSGSGAVGIYDGRGIVLQLVGGRACVACDSAAQPASIGGGAAYEDAPASFDGRRAVWISWGLAAGARTTRARSSRCCRGRQAGGLPSHASP